MINKVHNIDFLNNDLPDKCAKLIIADPPYYKVKGDFDFIWKTFDDYLKDVEKWAKECKRILADNGTLLWYGDAKNIAYAQIIFDKHFNLLNSIVWENTNDHKQQIRFNDDLRTFTPCTERILFYGSKVQDITGRDFIEEKYIAPNNPFSIEIAKGMKKYNLREIDFRKLRPSKNGNLTGWCSNIILGSSNPTEKDWELIETIIKSGKKYDELRTEYDELRTEHEHLRRPFNNSLHLGDVIRLPNYETSDYDHDTIKPEKLTRILITTCSRENDLVVVPFAGSGTECAMAVKEKRTFIGYEITEKHAKMAQDRADKILKEPTLF